MRRALALALVCLVVTAGIQTLRQGPWHAFGPTPDNGEGASRAVAKAPPVESSPTPTPGPWAEKLFGGVTTHDFGVVPHGARLEHRFGMKNIYAVPLQITAVRAGCGCLAVRTSHPDRTPLEPQEEGWIDVVMDARHFAGHKKSALSVTVGPQYSSTVVLEVTADARADVVCTPREVDFGTVSQGQVPRHSIEVEHVGAADWRVVEVVNAAEAPFVATAPEPCRQADAGPSPRTGKVGYRLAVTLKPDAPPGPFRRDLLLKTNDPSAPILTVGVQGNVRPPLTVTPGVVNLGTVKVGDTASFRIAVRGDRPFRILAVAGTDTGLTVELPARPAALHILTLRYRPDEVGEWRKHLTIRTDLDDGASVAVTVEAKVH